MSNPTGEALAAAAKAGMKAKPVKLVPGEGYVACPKEEATHVTLHIPGPSGVITLPVITRGARAGTGCWTWNGDMEKPTLRPSVATRGYDGRDGIKADFVCHSWINDGRAQFLSDSTHEHAGQTLDLLAIP